MFDTDSVFNVLAADDTDRRVASRRALALAHTRVESHLGGFLRQAASAEDFTARFAACQEDFEAYVRTAAEEHGYEHPEYLAKSLHSHYEHAAMVKEAPGKKHMPGVSDKRNRQYEHIKDSLLESGADEDRAKEEAARTVNKTRRKHHELKHEGGFAGTMPPAPTAQQGMQGQLPPQTPPPTTPDQLQQMTGTPAMMPQALSPQDLGQQQGMQPGMGMDLGQPGGQPPFLSKRQWTPFLGDKTGGWGADSDPRYVPPVPVDPTQLSPEALQRHQQQPNLSEEARHRYDPSGDRAGMDPYADPHLPPLEGEIREYTMDPMDPSFGDPYANPHEDPGMAYYDHYEPPMQDNLEANPPRRAGFNGELDPADPAVQHMQQQFEGVHPDQYNTDGVWMPSDQEQQTWGFGEPAHTAEGGHMGPLMAYPQGEYASPNNMLPPLNIADPGYGTHQGASFNPSDQDESKASDTVPCPECGGDGKTANNSQCPKCKGKGRVPNFGPSVIDSSVHTADDGNHGNTDLDGPEPKMDKRLWTPQSVGNPDPDSEKHPTKVKDILEPMKAVNDEPLSEIGEGTTEKETLPTATDFDSSGFDSTSKPGPAPHTKTWNGDSGQAKPVTQDVLD